jgi:hypothetical protein
MKEEAIFLLYRRSTECIIIGFIQQLTLEIERQRYPNPSPDDRHRLFQTLQRRQWAFAEVKVEDNRHTHSAGRGQTDIVARYGGENFLQS